MQPSVLASWTGNANAVTAAQACHLVKDGSRDGKGTASIGGVHNARDAALTRATGQHQVDLHQKENFTLFSSHNVSPLRRQPRVRARYGAVN